MELPNFIVLECMDKDNLSYKRDGGETNGYLQFSGSQAVSPYAKFDVELSKTDGLVHIRSCQNNKYWRRRQDNGYVTATAEKKDDDQSKESCTLFEFISVDPALNTVRIKHVQSGLYLCLWWSDNPVLQRCVLAYYKEYDPHSCDIFRVIDWSSLLILPRHVAFKGEGDCKSLYLDLNIFSVALVPMALQFFARDKGEPTVHYEIIPTNDGNIRIKQSATQKFWRRNSENWLVADSDDTSSNNKDTVFRPVKVDDQTIALINLGNNQFVTRHLKSSPLDIFMFDSLKATDSSITNETRLTVEEAVMSREIYDAIYDVDSGRVYNESVLTVAKNGTCNYTKEIQSMTVELKYKDTKTRSWNNSFSLSAGVQASMEFNIPFIGGFGIEISTEVQSVQEWGETEETATEVTVQHTVVVPPMTMVTVNLVATRGTCDVPLSYLQKDTLYDGTTVTTKVLGAYFKGANYYNFSFVDKEKPVTLPLPL